MSKGKDQDQKESRSKRKGDNSNIDLGERLKLNIGGDDLAAVYPHEQSSLKHYNQNVKNIEFATKRQSDWRQILENNSIGGSSTS